ncbi:MAG TPA: ATP-binding protein [Rhodopila sp.]|nr:ATP-binding protein [Rhodopila sp.]
MSVPPTERTAPLILNADGDAVNRVANTRSLRLGGMGVVEAEDGVDALSLMEARGPSLVLLGVWLPDMAAADLCRRIKAIWPDTIVVQGLVAGGPASEPADCILVTPVEPVELVSVVGAMLRLRQAEAQAREAPERLNAALEPLVAQRTQALADANTMLRVEFGERERMGEQIRQLQKMEALGQLTGGIVHDFNNLLTAILGGLEVTRRRIDDPACVRLLDASISAAQRGAKLIGQLLAFARRQQLHVERLSLDGLVRETDELLVRSLGPLVTLEHELAGDVWPVMADASQVQTALLNLAINARDAMPDGGVLRIGCGNRSVAGGEADLPAGDYAVLTVQDTGTGMTEAVRQQAFEPFFTTKELGKGTGLGLAQVYGFVRQSGGSVRIDSAVGGGTTITVWLPRAMPGPAGG